VSLAAAAQSDAVVVDSLPQTRAFKFGYLSYDSVLQAMPGYQLAQQQLADLKAQYEAELKRAEDEFNRKYEEFLDGQKEFPRSIMLKRQTELKELMERNMAFKQTTRQELAKAETDAMTPLRQRLNEALTSIARKRGYALIFNTDSNACPFIDPMMGEDINKLILDALQ
jgi:outer membrane protein